MINNTYLINDVFGSDTNVSSIYMLFSIVLTFLRTTMLFHYIWLLLHVLCIRQLPHIKSYCIGHGHGTTWMGCVWGRQRQRRTPKWFSIQYSMSGIPSSLCSSLSLSFSRCIDTSISLPGMDCCYYLCYTHVVFIIIIVTLPNRRNRKEKKCQRWRWRRANGKCWYSWRRTRERGGDTKKENEKKVISILYGVDVIWLYCVRVLTHCKCLVQHVPVYVDVSVWCMQCACALARLIEWKYRMKTTYKHHRCCCCFPLLSASMGAS